MGGMGWGAVEDNVRQPENLNVTARPGVILDLTPTASERFRLSNGEPIEVAKATPKYRLWRGPPPSSTYGGKAVLDYSGRAAFAELIVLWSLQLLGWKGAWITHAGGREIYRNGLMDAAPLRNLPSELTTFLAGIRAKRGTSGGTWDVCCFRDGEFLFAESKRKGRDSIKQDQVNWFETALNSGLPLSSFLVVEWTADELPQRYPVASPSRVVQASVNARPLAPPTEQPAFSSDISSDVLVFPAGEVGAKGRFMAWREANPLGYVVNLRAPRDAMVHLARCHTLGEPWDVPMLNAKFGALSLADLNEFAQGHGWVRRVCGYCAQYI